MDWKEALTALIEVAPKLAFKPELVEQLKSHLNQSKPPQLLFAQIDVMLAIARQNQRVADLHGYPALETYAKRLEVACSNTLSALRAAGVPPVTKPSMSV